MADVAAGEGALQTWSVRSVCSNIKSWTRVPSRRTACARIPAFSGSRSSKLRDGQYFLHSLRYPRFRREFRISIRPDFRLAAIVFQNPGNAQYSDTSRRLKESLE